MNYEEEFKIKHKTPSISGRCNSCKNAIFEDELFVDLKGLMYHFSCHNRKVQKENENKNE